MDTDLAKYDPEQARDDQGRFAGGADGPVMMTGYIGDDPLASNTALTGRMKAYLREHPGDLTVYHGTAEKYVADILREGLSLDASRSHRMYAGAFYPGARGGSVFVSRDVGEAMRWAEAASQHAANLEESLTQNPHHAALITVRIPRSEIGSLGSDRMGNSVSDLTFKGSIKPEWIVGAEVQGKDGWHRIEVPTRKAERDLTLYLVVLTDGGEVGKAFNPDQPRDDHGRFSSGGGEGGAVAGPGHAPPGGRSLPLSERTPEFRAWFGDSKVVNEDGTPRAVFHGSRASFSEFKPGGVGPPPGWKPHTGQFSGGRLPASLAREGEEAPPGGFYESGPAIWFTPEPSGIPAAHHYSDDGTKGDQVYPVYLRMEHPLVLEGIQGKNPKGLPTSSYVILPAEIEAAKRAGYDGVIQTKGGKAREYVVFEPSQVKSVFNTKPTNHRDMTKADEMEKSLATIAGITAALSGFPAHFSLEHAGHDPHPLHEEHDLHPALEGRHQPEESAWNEELHPRDERGRFAQAGNAAMEATTPQGHADAARFHASFGHITGGAGMAHLEARRAHEAVGALHAMGAGSVRINAASHRARQASARAMLVHPPMMKAYNPDQPRDERGRFGSGGSGAKDEGGQERAASAATANAATWGSFEEYDGLQRKILVDLQKEQIAWEASGKPAGTRCDMKLGEPPTIEAARTLIKGGGTQPDADFVLTKGTEFKVPDEPPPIPIGVPKLCYENAAKLVLGDDRYDYAEGYTVSSHQMIMPVAHAWAVDKATGAVVDPTLGWRPDARYIGVALEKHEMAVRLARSGVYGLFYDGKGAPTRLAQGLDSGYIHGKG